MKNYIDKTICIRAQFTQPLTICDDGSDCCNYIQIKYNQVIICDVISEGFSNETLNAREGQILK
jgi:hypothetical protein